MGRWRALGYHLGAVAIGLTAGLWSAGVGTDRASAGRVLPFSLLGLRGSGYAALFLLGLALMIGPLARVWPRRLSRLLLWRRAVGVWSALVGGLHLLFAWWMLTRDAVPFLRRPFLEHFGRFVGERFFIHLEPVTLVVWFGLFSLVILFVIALTSNDPVQRLLGPSAWKLVQQQAYVGFAFAALHVLTMLFAGKMKGNPPLIAGVQWFLAVVVGLQALGFATSVWRGRRHPGRPSAG